MQIVRLGTDDRRDTRFDCGDSDLNEFFFKDSYDLCRELMSVTYALEENGRTIAFFSVSNDALKREDLPRTAFSRATKDVPRPKSTFKSQPAVKIGRLAVNSNDENRGIAGKILDYIKVWFTHNNKTGCRFIIVDAYNKDKPLHVYKKNGFSFIYDADSNDDTRMMYFDLSEMTKPVPTEP